MNKREVAASVIGRPALSPLRSKAKAIRILAYHRVVAKPWDEFAFDEEIISATPEAFEAQMRFAKKNFEVISFRDLESCEREGKPWPDRSLIVTFDDGYRDNLTEAFPILRELNIPATIFLTTGHIGQSKLFWWDLIAYCFKQTKLSSVIVPYLSKEPINLKSHLCRRVAMSKVFSYVKSVPDAQRCSLVEQLPVLLNVTIPSDLALGMHLNWDEVRQMAKGGIEFGSHTVDHPIMSRADAEVLHFQASESKSTIERELNEPVLVFAYPDGTRQHRSEAAQAAVAAAGYSFAVIYDQGVEACPDRTLMPRIHVDRDQTLSLFRANLLFPSFMLRS